MEGSQELTIFLCIVVIFLIISMVSNNIKMRKCFIGGFWSAPAQFCMKSGLKDAYMLIKPEDENMFIVMNNTEGMILSKIVKYKLSGSGFSDTMEGRLTFDKSVEPLPESCNVKMNVSEGMMGLYDDNDKVIMVMYKDNKSTAGVV
jgi:hypothetical protein